MTGNYMYPDHTPSKELRVGGADFAVSPAGVTLAVVGFGVQRATVKFSSFREKSQPLIPLQAADRLLFAL